MGFDESGNTGGNLLDAAQPVFSLASLNLSNDEAISLGASPEAELKFSRLRRSDVGRTAVLRILNSELLSEERLAVTAFHKPFLAVAKLVDLVIEPFLHEGGLNLYDRGGNLAMANMIYFTWPVIIGRPQFTELQTRFIAVVREPTKANADGFYRFVQDIRRTAAGDVVKVELDLILWGRGLIEEEMNHWSSNALDPAIPAFVEQGAVWTARIRQPFTLVHDRAKPIEQEQLVLEAMLSTNDLPVEIGFDRRKMLFPIRADKLVLADSKEHLPLQIADILSGAVAHILTLRFNNGSSEFAEQLLETKALSGSFRPVWPELKITPEELGTNEPAGMVDPAQQIGEYIAGKLGGIPPPGKRRKE